MAIGKTIRILCDEMLLSVNGSDFVPFEKSLFSVINISREKIHVRPSLHYWIELHNGSEPVLVQTVKVKENSISFATDYITIDISLVNAYMVENNAKVYPLSYEALKTCILKHFYIKQSGSKLLIGTRESGSKFNSIKEVVPEEIKKSIEAENIMRTITKDGLTDKALDEAADWLKKYTLQGGIE